MLWNLLERNPQSCMEDSNTTVASDPVDGSGYFDAAVLQILSVLNSRIDQAVGLDTFSNCREVPLLLFSLY